MSEFYPIKELPEKIDYNENDTLVIFGEVFERGYVNGLIREAKKQGMKIIYSTVGRRDNDGTLRPLTDEEMKEKNQSPMINVPLEAGFDLEKMDELNVSITEALSKVKSSEWKEFSLEEKHIQSAVDKGRERFKKNVESYINELEKLLPDTGRVVFAHTMAGGIPKAKIIFSLMNKIIKGYGARFASSEEFVKSPMGQLCERNFKEVTGETLHTLLTMTEPLRKKLQSQNRHVSYVAYGYHGTVIQQRKNYKWYSFSPYIQGRAKLHLESISKSAFSDGISCCVFNVPEILTNSSGIFQGIELAMYPLLEELEPHINKNPFLSSLFKDMNSKLNEGASVTELFDLAQSYFDQPQVQGPLKFETWPQENSPEVMDVMREISQKIIEIHKDQKDMVVFPISEVIFRACGKIILHSCQKPAHHMGWIGHDVILKSTLKETEA